MGPPQGAPVTYEQAKKKGLPWRKIIGAAILIFILGMVGCMALVDQAVKEVDRGIKAEDAAGLADVGAPQCAPGVLGMEAKGSVTNSSSKRSNYYIEVKAVGPAGEQLGTGSASISNLDPGQQGTYEAYIPNVPEGTQVTCELVDANRMEAL